MALDSIETARKEIAKIYIAAFNRVPDEGGLQNWMNQYMAGLMTYAQISTDFTRQAEYTAAYPSYLTSSEYITEIYQNVFGRMPDAGGLQNWINQIDNTSITGIDRSNVMYSMLQSASATGNTDGVRLTNQATFAVQSVLDDIPTATATAQLANITSDAATVTTATAAVNAAETATETAGQAFTLTEGVDTIVGTSGNDTISASHTTAKPVVGGLDSIDGGAGTDTVSIADTLTAGTAAFTLPAGMTITNVETLKVTTNGSIGDDASAATAFNISAMTGLTSFTGTAAGDGTTTDTSVIAANTTDVTLTVSAAQDVDVLGGKVVSVTGGAAGSTISGDALTTVTVANNAGMTVNNTVAGAGTGTGTTLTKVILNSDSAIAIQGAALTTIDLSTQGAAGTARTVTLTNGTADHSLTINANGTGYQNNTAATEKQTVLTEAVATATSATINTSAKSSLDLTGITTIKSLTLTGAGALTLAAMGATTTSINGSAATGNLILGDLNAAAVTVKTGAGNDSLAVKATAKTTVETGAGNDTVTLKSALAAGSTVTLGAGDDKLLFGTGSSVAISTLAAVTVIDAGDGTDTLSANLVIAGNAAQFKNFENLALDSTTGLDVSLITGITGLTLDNASTTATYQNVTAAQSLTVNADATSGVNTLSMTGVTGAADAYSITFNGTTTGTVASPTDINAGTVVINGIENVTVHSNSAAGVNKNIITLTDAQLQVLTIDGSQAATVAFTGTNGTIVSTVGGVSLIDGSTATGKLVIDVANVTAAAAGITVKGGTAVDTLTTSTFSTTLHGGTGPDNFIVTATTAGAVASATTQKVTTIDDIGTGDVITFTIGGTNVFTTAKVDVTTATALSGGTTNAYDLAVSAAGNTNNQITWFQYGTDTYIVNHAGTSATDLDTADVIVKLVGLHDLSTATFAEGGAAASTLTIA